MGRYLEGDFDSLVEETVDQEDGAVEWHHRQEEGEEPGQADGGYDPQLLHVVIKLGEENPGQVFKDSLVHQSSCRDTNPIRLAQQPTVVCFRTQTFLTSPGSVENASIGQDHSSGLRPNPYTDHVTDPHLITDSIPGPLNGPLFQESNTNPNQDHVPVTDLRFLTNPSAVKTSNTVLQ